METLQDKEKKACELPDGVLAQQALDGNEYAFETLVHRYSSYLFSFIFHLLGDYDRACDVHQQVLFQLYCSLPSLSQDKSFKPWLFRVAHNRCIDQIRCRRLFRFSELEEAGEETDNELTEIVDWQALPEKQVEQQDLQQCLLQSIEELPQHYRRIVLLRYLTQLTFAEIGKTLRIPSSTAKTYFHRACLILRKTLVAKDVFEMWPD